MQLEAPATNRPERVCVQSGKPQRVGKFQHVRLIPVVESCAAAADGLRRSCAAGQHGCASTTPVRPGRICELSGSSREILGLRGHVTAFPARWSGRGHGKVRGRLTLPSCSQSGGMPPQSIADGRDSTDNEELRPEQCSQASVFRALLSLRTSYRTTVSLPLASIRTSRAPTGTCALTVAPPGHRTCNCAGPTGIAMTDTGLSCDQ